MKFLVLLMSFMVMGCLEIDAPPQIEIIKPYAFATATGARSGAAFMVISNKGGADKLIDAKSKISEITEIHENLIDPDDGMMMMRKIRAIDISGRGETVLEPTGYHIMFIKLKEPLSMGDTINFTLVFEQAGEVVVSAKVIAPGTKP